MSRELEVELCGLLLHVCRVIGAAAMRATRSRSVCGRCRREFYSDRTDRSTIDLACAAKEKPASTAGSAAVSASVRRFRGWLRVLALLRLPTILLPLRLRRPVRGFRQQHQLQRCLVRRVDSTTMLTYILGDFLQRLILSQGDRNVEER